MAKRSGMHTTLESLRERQEAMSSTAEMRIGDLDPSLAGRPQWGSGVSNRAHALVDRRLGELDASDLAFCLRQQIAVAAVMDRVIEILATQALLEAEFYDGDLLLAAIHAERSGWASPAQRSELRDICASASAAIATLVSEVSPEIEDMIRRHDGV